MPFAKGSKGFAGALAKGWGINAMVVLSTGIPFDITNSSARSNTGGSDRPNVIGDPTTGFTQSPSAWFNVSAFAPQPLYTFGNLGRNVLHAPGRRSLDLAIHREFVPKEGMRLQFRFETFNLTNTPPFAFPGGGLRSGDVRNDQQRGSSTKRSARPEAVVLKKSNCTERRTSRFCDRGGPRGGFFDIITISSTRIRIIRYFRRVSVSSVFLAVTSSTATPRSGRIKRMQRPFTVICTGNRNESPVGPRRFR